MDDNDKGLRFEIGRCANVDFKVFLDGEDITSKLLITRLEFKLTPEVGPTVVQMELIANGISVLAGRTDVTFNDEELYRRKRAEDPVHYVPKLHPVPDDEEEQEGWYFWIETWCDRIGPYISEEAANKALRRYCEMYL